MAVFNDDGERVQARYTIMYTGYLFVGDSDDVNCWDAETLNQIMDIANAYPDIVTIRDNEYDVVYSHGKWQ